MSEDYAEARRADDALDEDDANQMAFRKLIYGLAGDDVDPGECGPVEAAERAVDRVAALEEENDQLRQRVNDLQQENEQLRDSAELFQQARRNAAPTREQQAAMCLKSMVAKASRPSGNDRQELDASGIVDTLHGEIHRTNTYDVMDTVEEIVDDEDVAWVQQEPRSSPRNTRLIVDLSKGDVPTTVAGVTINDGVSVA